MINIGNRRECFFDDFLLDLEKSTARRLMHKPTRRNVILNFDRDWEGGIVTYLSTFFVDGIWKCYYMTIPQSDRLVCYMESRDGEVWTRPELDIVEWNGSKKNNIILNLDALAKLDFKAFDNMSVFYDKNPDCPENEKYKMVAWWGGHASLVYLSSADGLHFKNLRLITADGEFDSQNVAFWSGTHEKYFCYYRGEHDPSESTPVMDKSYTDETARALFDPEKFIMREPGDGTLAFMRDVCAIDSTDFENWSERRRIEYNGTDFQMYTNCVFEYPRAPHIFVAFPLRYTERKSWTKNYDELCGKEERLLRMKKSARGGLAITDSLFMSSRDGYRFTKFDEAFIQPPPENPDSFVYGDTMATPTLFEISSDIPGADNEYMIHVRESYRSSCAKLTKYTIRLDGFVSLHSGDEPCVAVTKEFTYSGEELYANIATSARGSVYFTLISGDERYESCETFGNSVDKRIRFDDDETVKKLSGKPVRLEMRLYDADLYSINFR